ncbi:hypothetical protein VTI74DRAFT_1284 [Chaetomium olivicolor]
MHLDVVLLVEVLDVGRVAPALFVAAAVDRREDDVLHAVRDGGVDEADGLCVLRRFGVVHGDEEDAVDRAAGLGGEDWGGVGDVALQEGEVGGVRCGEGFRARGVDVAGDGEEREAGGSRGKGLEGLDDGTALLSGGADDEEGWGGIADVLMFPEEC